MGLGDLALALPADEVDLAALAAEQAPGSGGGAADDLEGAVAAVPRKRRNIRNRRNKAPVICLSGLGPAFPRNIRHIVDIKGFFSATRECLWRMLWRMKVL